MFRLFNINNRRDAFAKTNIKCKLFCAFPIERYINLVGFRHFLLIFDGIEMY